MFPELSVRYSDRYFINIKNKNLSIHFFLQEERAKGNVVGLGQILLQKSILANQEEKPKFDLVRNKCFTAGI